MKWLFENLSTIIIFAVLAAVIVLIIKSMRKDKKSGKSSNSHFIFIASSLF